MCRTESTELTARKEQTLCTKHAHITPVLRLFHWLPIKARIDYNIMTLSYQCINGTAPIYLADLRSAEQNLLQVTKWKLNHLDIVLSSICLLYTSDAADE